MKDRWKQVLSDFDTWYDGLREGQKILFIYGAAMLACILLVIFATFLPGVFLFTVLVGGGATVAYFIYWLWFWEGY